MSSDHRDMTWLDVETFNRNRAQFPAAELWKHAGRYIAWSGDGSRIVASGESEAELERNLRAAGIDPSQVVGDYVDPPDGSLLG